jgi:hypothetical protein
MPQTSSPSRLRYHSFILALWQEADRLGEEHASWRFSLEDPHTAARVGFTSIDELASHLQTWTQRHDEHDGS